MLIGTVGKIENSSNYQFSDTNQNDWFYVYAVTAYDKGIVKGFPDNSFGGENIITRQEMAVLVYRTANVLGISVSDDSKTSDFVDESSISDYAVLPIKAMKNVGIISGMPDGTFVPLGNATRAEAAVMVSRLLQKLR